MQTQNRYFLLRMTFLCCTAACLAISAGCGSNSNRNAGPTVTVQAPSPAPSTQPVSAAPNVDRPTDPGALIVDRDYLEALSVLDRCLHAWQIRDKTGLELVSEKAKRGIKPDELAIAFIGVSNPHHQAYEVTGDRRVDRDTFRFQVREYEYYTGEEVSAPLPSPIEFDVVRMDGQWLVDRLP